MAVSPRCPRGVPTVVVPAVASPPPSPSPRPLRPAAAGVGAGTAFAGAAGRPGEGVRGPDQLRRLQRWLAPPLQAQRLSLVPLAVALPGTSRHSPDCTPVMVPLALTFHCWFGCPLQSQITTWVPLAV